MVIGRLRMAKRLIILTALLVAIALAAHSPYLKGRAAPPLSETAKTEPNNLDSAQTDPNETIPVAAEPNQPDPNELQPAPADPNKPAPTKPDPNEPKLENIDPNNTDANDITPAAIEPNDVNAIDANDTHILKTEPNDPNTDSATSFHDKCAHILQTYVRPDGKVNYNKLKRKKPNIYALLYDFNKLDPKIYESWSKQDKIAFWINAYNIKMLHIIVNNYPIEPISRFHSAIWGAKSIRHIEGKWTKHKFLVMDEVFTLLEIDERFFRKQFDEPRVVFALTRASLSSPPLRNEPYYGSKLDKQLDDQTKKFISSPLAFKIDRKKGKVYLSALFQKPAYGKMFVGKYGIDRKFKGKEPETRAVLNFITNFVSEDTKEYLELGNYTVQFMGYNWTINDGS